MQDFANINAGLILVLLGAHLYTVKETRLLLQQNIHNSIISYLTKSSYAALRPWIPMSEPCPIAEQKRKWVRSSLPND